MWPAPEITASLTCLLVSASVASEILRPVVAVRALAVRKSFAAVPQLASVPAVALAVVLHLWKTGSQATSTCMWPSVVFGCFTCPLSLLAWTLVHLFSCLLLPAPSTCSLSGCQPSCTVSMYAVILEPRESSGATLVLCPATLLLQFLLSDFSCALVVPLLPPTAP